MTFRIVRSLSPFGRGVLVTLVLVGMFALGAFAQDKRAKRNVEHMCVSASAVPASLTEKLNELAAKGWRLRTTSMVTSGMKFKTLACLTR